MTWYAIQTSRNQRAQLLPRSTNTPPRIARSRRKQTQTMPYSNGRCVLNSVTWYANPMTPAATNMQPMTVTESGRLFMVCGRDPISIYRKRSIIFRNAALCITWLNGKTGGRGDAETLGHGHRGSGTGDPMGD